MVAVETIAVLGLACFFAFIAALSAVVLYTVDRAKRQAQDAEPSNVVHLSDRRPAANDYGDAEFLAALESGYLPPDRRLRLYLRIARDARQYPDSQGLRRAAIKNAWEARREMRGKEK